MKINEKNLCAFAVSDSPIDKEGYLNKISENRFQRRYFVLKGNLLFYFEKSGDKEPIGVIILEGSTVELSEEVVDQYCFKIVFHGVNNRTYIFTTDTHESMVDWMKMIARASYDYLKILVEDLRRQVAEIDDPSLIEQEARALPIAPPRQRHNPFNKPQIPQEKSENVELQPKACISFKELHIAYGRPILRDFNLWKNQQKHLRVDNLITF